MSEKKIPRTSLHNLVKIGDFVRLDIRDLYVLNEASNKQLVVDMIIFFDARHVQTVSV